jgi:hypothetical protein
MVVMVTPVMLGKQRLTARRQAFVLGQSAQALDEVFASILSTDRCVLLARLPRGDLGLHLTETRLALRGQLTLISGCLKTSNEASEATSRTRCAAELLEFLAARSSTVRPVGQSRCRHERHCKRRTQCDHSRHFHYDPPLGFLNSICMRCAINFGHRAIQASCVHLSLITTPRPHWLTVSGAPRSVNFAPHRSHWISWVQLMPHAILCFEEGRLRKNLYVVPARSSTRLFRWPFLGYKNTL